MYQFLTNSFVLVFVVTQSLQTISHEDDITIALEASSSNKAKISALHQIESMPIDQRTDQLMQVVLRLTTHANDEVRTVAIGALSSFGKMAVPYLVPLLQARDNESAFAAATALGKMGTHASEAAAPLAKLIDDSIAGKLASPHKNDLLRSRYSSMVSTLPKVMVDDAVTLKYGDRWIQLYIRLSQRGHYDNIVSKAAFLIVERAAKMKGNAEPLVPSLISIYSLPDYKHKDLYLAVTRTLGEIGPDASSALPHLNKLLDSDLQGIGIAAEKSIKKINTKNQK